MTASAEITGSDHQKFGRFALAATGVEPVDADETECSVLMMRRLGCGRRSKCRLANPGTPPKATNVGSTADDSSRLSYGGTRRAVHWHSGEKLKDSVEDLILLVVVHFRKERQRQHGVGRLFRDWECAFSITKM